MFLSNSPQSSGSHIQKISGLRPEGDKNPWKSCVREVTWHKHLYKIKHVSYCDKEVPERSFM